MKRMLQPILIENRRMFLALFFEKLSHLLAETRLIYRFSFMSIIMDVRNYEFGSCNQLEDLLSVLNIKIMNSYLFHLIMWETCRYSEVNSTMLPSPSSSTSKDRQSRIPVSCKWYMIMIPVEQVYCFSWSFSSQFNRISFTCLVTPSCAG